MRDDQIFLDVHHIVHACSTQLGELSSAFLQELTDVVALLALISSIMNFKIRRSFGHPASAHLYRLSVTCPIPVTVCDLDRLVLQLFLLLEPFFPELFAL